jgi:hypothetical protein
MRCCPACNQSLSSNETSCPKCGVTLHPFFQKSDADGTDGASTYVLIVVGIGLIFVMMICLGCLGVRNSFIRSLSPF